MEQRTYLVEGDYLVLKNMLECLEELAVKRLAFSPQSMDVVIERVDSNDTYRISVSSDEVDPDGVRIEHTARFEADSLGNISRHVVESVERTMTKDMVLA